MFEYTDGTGVFEAAFEGEVVDFLVGQVEAEFVEAGWHFYGAEEVFHCFDSGEGGFFEICSVGDIEYVCCELGEAFRVYFVDVACPASPDAARPAP